MRPNTPEYRTKPGQAAPGTDRASAGPHQPVAEPDQLSSAAPASARPWRRVILIRIGLIVVGLALLLGWVLEQWPQEALRIPYGYLLAALLLNQAALLAAALRLQATLGIFGIAIGSGQALRIHLQSLFYFFFVPMSVGLELGRFIELRRLAPGAPASRILLALLADRLLGLIGVILVTVMTLPMVLPGRMPAELPPGWLAWTAGIGAGVTIAGTVLFLVQARLRRVILALLILDRASVRRLLGLSAASMLLVVAAVLAIAQGAAVAIGFGELGFALGIALLGMVLPVSVLGATLGEGAGIGAFVFLGLPPAAALLLVSAAYCGRLVGALQGAVIELIRALISRGPRALAPTS